MRSSPRTEWLSCCAVRCTIRCGAQLGQRILAARARAFGEVSACREDRAGAGMDDEMLRAQVFDRQFDEAFEFQHGRYARIFVRRRDVVGLIGQVQPPEIGFRRADRLAAFGEQPVEPLVGHVGGEDDLVAGHDVDAHTRSHGTAAVGGVDLIDRDEFARFELQVLDRFVGFAEFGGGGDGYGCGGRIRFAALVAAAARCIEQKRRCQEENDVFHDRMVRKTIGRQGTPPDRPVMQFVRQFLRIAMLSRRCGRPCSRCPRRSCPSGSASRPSRRRS